MYGTEKIMILLKSYSFRDSELCRIVRKLQFVRCGRYIIGLNEFSVCAVNEASVCWHIKPRCCTIKVAR